MASCNRSTHNEDNHHTKDDLRCKYIKATSYMNSRGYGSNFHGCYKLYRDHNDMALYFQVLSDNVIPVRIKDMHGDQKSPINGRLSGVFFSANVDFSTGQPKEPSIYGPHRILIPPSDVVSLCPNLYFADFYCNYTESHYVTLVMTKPGTASDTFCESSLPRLNIKTNPFFQENNGQFSVTGHLWVEIFVT